MAQKERYRFPGLNAYTREDANLFKGREEDAAKLHRKISLYKTLVLHAESGTGKSSLIQAGLIPLIEQSGEHYFPITIRMNEILPIDDEALLVDFVIRKILRKFPDLLETNSEENNPTETDLSLLKEQPPSLWNLDKLLEFEKKKKLLLIFDQFENLQNFSSLQIGRFITGLFDLLNQKMPSSIDSAIEKQFALEANTNTDKYKKLNQTYLFLTQPSTAKVLFVIREDKLGVMSLLADVFPDIIKNDFIIKPLDQTLAIQALIEPAKAKGEFVSPAFEFETENLAKDLVGIIADNDTKLVDPIQLQIVASNIEKNVVIKNGKTILGAKDIPEVNDIISEYYDICWENVKNALKFTDLQINHLQRDIVPHLLVGDRRDLVASEKIKTSHDAVKVVNKLVKIGFLREIPYGKNTFYYQLCHDRLIKPIQKDIIKFNAEDHALEKEKKEKKRLEEERKKAIYEAKKQKIILTATIIIASILIIGSIFFIRQANNSEFKQKEEKIIGIVKLLRTTNPTLAIEILKEFELNYKSKTSTRYKDYIGFFDSSKYAFQTGFFPFTGSMVDITKKASDSTIVITDKYYSTTWNTKQMFIENQRRISNGYFFKKKTINENGRTRDIYLVVNGDSLEIQSSDGHVEKTFLFSEKNGNIDISKDGKYIVIGKVVYNTSDSKKPIGSLEEFAGINDHDQMTTIFLNDGKHIAVGYWSGYKLIYRIDENHKDKIRVSAVFKPADWQVNYVITCFAVDKKDKFLYVGTRGKFIEVWSLDSLECVDGVCNKELNGEAYLKIISKRMRITQALKILKAHSDNITSLEVSPSDSLLLSGSDDNTSILWDCKNWKKLSVIKGRLSKVKHVGFLNNDMTLFTTTEDQLLLIWSREKASDLYKKGELSKFSPFDYYNVGYGQNNESRENIYDTTSTKDYFSNTLRYIISMPLTNQYPEDAYYLKNIRQSLTEIETMFKGVTSRKNFSKVISKENQKMFYRYYNELELIKLDLLLQTDDENESEKIDRFNQYYTRYSKQLLFDTSSVDIITAVDIANKFMDFAKYYSDSLNYNEAVAYCEKAIYINEAFYKKFRPDPNLKIALSRAYGNISFYSVFNGEYKKTIDYAKKGLEIDPMNNDWINTNLALGYLMGGQFSEAEKIYIKFSKRFYYNNPGISFKDAFLGDLAAVEKAGLILKNENQLNNEVEKIIEILGQYKPAH